MPFRERPADEPPQQRRSIEQPAPEVPTVPEATVPTAAPADTAERKALRETTSEQLAVEKGDKKMSDQEKQYFKDMLKIPETTIVKIESLFKYILENKTYANIEFESCSLESLLNPEDFKDLPKDFDIQDPKVLETASKVFAKFMVVLINVDHFSEDQMLIKGEEGKAISEKLKDKETWQKNLTFSYKANKLTVFYQEPGKEKQTIFIVDVKEEDIKKGFENFSGFLQDLAVDTPAAAPIEDEIPDAPAGKLHTIYEEQIDKVTEEKTKSDMETLGKVDIQELRKNSRILNKPADGETDPDKVTNLHDEAARRIKACTSSYKDGWYTLDYGKLDSQREAGLPSHENNTGLGEVCGIDPDITNIMVKRGNKLIRCHRGIVESGENKGRIAYLDDRTNAYVWTHSGDKFKILSETRTDVKVKEKVDSYVKQLRDEQPQRDAHTPTYSQSSSAETGSATLTSTVTYKSPETTLAGSKLTVQKIQAAEKECSKGGTIEQVLGNRPNFMAVVHYAAKEVGIPPWVLMGVMFHESRFNYLVKNKEHQGERGIGQFKAAAWSSVKKDAKFHTTARQIMEEDTATIDRQSSILADVMGVAIFLKRAIPEVSYLTHLNQEQLEDMRWRYHVPGYRSALKGGKFSAEYKGKAQAFMDSKKAKDGAGSIYGYKYFADTCIRFERAWKSKYGDKGEKADW